MKGKGAAQADAVNLPTWLTLVGFMAVSTAVSALLHFTSKNFPDPDSFYHFGHAQVYIDKGPFYQEFPWAAFSVIGQVGADIWWGFHVALMPFAQFEDPLVGLKAASFSCTFALLVLLFFAFRRMNVAHPWLWPFLVLFASPWTTVRFEAVRPSLVSMPLFALLLVLVIQRASAWKIALCAFAIGFIHQTFSWTALVLVVVGFVAKASIEREFAFKESLAAFAGLAASWILRPDPLGALELMKVQIIDLARLKSAGTPIAFGTEVYPMAQEAWQSIYLPFLSLWAVTIVLMLFTIYVRKRAVPRGDLTTMWALLVLSIGYFMLTAFSTQRGIEPWVVFAAMLIAIVWSRLIIEHKKFRAAATIGASTVVAGLATWCIAFSQKHLQEYAINPERNRPAMEWLKSNTEAGELVFQPYWSAFAESFFWNKHNVFIGGMDPVFQYSFDPGLYFAVLRLEERGATDITSKSLPGEDPIPYPTFDLISKDFGSRHLFLYQDRSKQLYEYALSDNRFRLAFYDPDSRIAIFELQD